MERSSRQSARRNTMAILKCKMCGGDIVLNEDKSIGMCEYCGSMMTFPKIADDQRAGQFNRGNHFRRQGEFDRALAIYEAIVRDDDTDAEAHWCCALCRFGIEYVEDPNTFEYVPTCHRASFDSILTDVDYLAAIENSDGITRRQYQKDAARIAEVQKGILATSQNEAPFDVFICYKETDDNTKERTRDSLDAQEIYYQLTQEGYRVFFSRITLEDKVGTEYEPYIFAALNSSKVMVSIGSKPEYFNAVWVKNEWSRFLALMRKDRSKLLLPCYKNMDPYDLPEQLSVLQSYDMSKIGFMQDLIRGIKKVLQKDEAHSEAEAASPVIQQVVQTTSGTNINALLKRVFMYLEDGEWSNADEYCERVLDEDPENAQAYLGKLLAALKFQKVEDIQEEFTQLTSRSGHALDNDVEGNANYRKFLRFADEGEKKKIQQLIEDGKEAGYEKIYSTALSDVSSIEKTDNAIFELRKIPFYKDSREKIIEFCEKRKTDIQNKAEELQNEKESLSVNAAEAEKQIKLVPAMAEKMALDEQVLQLEQEKKALGGDVKRNEIRDRISGLRIQMRSLKKYQKREFSKIEKEIESCQQELVNISNGESHIKAALAELEKPMAEINNELHKQQEKYIYEIKTCRERIEENKNYGSFKM